VEANERIETYCLKLLPGDFKPADALWSFGARLRSISLVGVAERFAENLVRIRHESEISQEDLAHRAEVHRTQISMMESARRLPRIDTLVKLAGALGIPPETLLEGIGWEPTVTKVGKFKVSEPKE
jgi:DNA-binding XRE family transcriptional regulator